MARTPNDELSTVDAMEARVADMTFDQLDAITADEIAGRVVLDKADMLKVPFIITGARFSHGKGNADFVSLEVTTKDNTLGVINDGSTGIRRMFVAWLTTKGMIDPGEGDETGKDTRYDNPCDKWDIKSDDIDLSFDEEGHAKVAVRNILLRCKNGLRRSDYVGPEGDATTYYLQ